jgi:UDP-glucuronate decarboxylase
LYIVTGASGWMGKTTLEYLKHQMNINLQSEVFCFSSVDREIRLSDGEVVKSSSLEKVSLLNREVKGIFHYAFLTRDFINKYGIDQYVATNNSILDLISGALLNLSYKWVVGISSGAVFDLDTHELAKDIKQNPYGFLKLREESLLQELSERSGANCVIGRLWASSGNLMPIDRKYAISDFIFQGLTSDEIRVKSRHQVWRRYMDAQDFISVLMLMAEQGLNEILDSAGELVELGELASKIGFLTSSKIMRSDSEYISSSDLYYPEGTEMQEVVQKYGLSVKSIDEQLASTISGHVQQLATHEGLKK